MDKTELTQTSGNGIGGDEEYAPVRRGPYINPAFDRDDATTDIHFSPMDGGGKAGLDNPAFTVEMQEAGSFRVIDYDPYANRVVEHPTTNAETLLHLLKGSLGTGILAMPNAFSQAGYIVGSIGTIVIGLLCTYCIHMLIKCNYELCKRRRVPSMTYTQVAEEALKEGPDFLKPVSHYSAVIVNAFLLTYQIGTCCVYVVFVSENLKSVINHYTGEDTDVKIYMCIIVVPLILINWVRNLKYLAPFSTLANLITVVSFAIITYYIFREPITLEGKEPVGKLVNFPLFFGTVLFALEAIGVILPLENEMKDPKSFGGNTGVLNRAMSIIVFLYVGMGLFGYLRYGEEAAGSITLNLPSDFEVLAQVVQLTLAAAIFITHALACYVAITIVWNEYIFVRIGGPDRPGVVYWEYLCRTCIVLVTFLLAVAVPALDLFISLFGALCLSALGLAFPAIIESCVWWNHITRRHRIIMTIKNTILVIIGLFGLVVGTYSAMAAIITEFSR